MPTTDQQSIAHTLAKRLLELRQARGKTGEWVAREAGVARATYFRLERGLTVPSAVSVAKVAVVLGVSMDWLCGLKDRP